MRACFGNSKYISLWHIHESVKMGRKGLDTYVAVLYCLLINSLRKVSYVNSGIGKRIIYE